MAGIWFSHSSATAQQRLTMLTAPYRDAANQVQAYWRLVSQAVSLIPWDATWFLRYLGKSDVCHSLSAAVVRGGQVSKTRGTQRGGQPFIKADDEQPHPWLVEDLVLRCGLAAEGLEAAHRLGVDVAPLVPDGLATVFRTSVASLARRVRAYKFHLRETNLARHLRAAVAGSGAVPPAWSTSCVICCCATWTTNEPRTTPTCRQRCAERTGCGAHWIWNHHVAQVPDGPFLPSEFRTQFYAADQTWRHGAMLYAADSELYYRVVINGVEVLQPASMVHCVRARRPGPAETGSERDPPARPAHLRRRAQPAVARRPSVI